MGLEFKGQSLNILLPSWSAQCLPGISFGQHPLFQAKLNWQICFIDCEYLTTAFGKNCEFTFHIYNAGDQKWICTSWQRTKPYRLFFRKGFSHHSPTHCLSGGITIPPGSKSATSQDGDEESLHFLGGKSPFDHKPSEMFDSWGHWEIWWFSGLAKVTNMPGRAETRSSLPALQSHRGREYSLEMKSAFVLDM